MTVQPTRLEHWRRRRRHGATAERAQVVLCAWVVRVAVTADAARVWNDLVTGIAQLVDYAVLRKLSLTRQTAPIYF